MPVALADLRKLSTEALTHASNPALLRLFEVGRTAEGLAGAYLPRSVWLRVFGGQVFSICTLDGLTRDATPGFTAHSTALDLTERGTAHALLVALALALGFDPGVDGLAVRWVACNGGGWMLQSDNPQHDPNYDASRFFTAAMTGHESVPVRALEFAVRHVLTVEGSNA